MMWWSWQLMILRVFVTDLHEFCLLISCILSFWPYQLLPEVLKKHACTLRIDQNLQRHCTVSLRMQLSCSFIRTRPHGRVIDTRDIPRRVFTARCTMHSAKRGLAIACRLSVRLSVCDVGDL